MCQIYLETLGVAYPVRVIQGDVFDDRHADFRVRSTVRLARGECCTFKNEKQQQVECFVSSIEEEGQHIILLVKRVPIH